MDRNEAARLKAWRQSMDARQLALERGHVRLLDAATARWGVRAEDLRAARLEARVLAGVSCALAVGAIIVALWAAGLRAPPGGGGSSGVAMLLAQGGSAFFASEGVAALMGGG